MAKKDLNRSELARLIKEHESLKPINRTSAKTVDGKVQRRVNGKFASPQKFVGANRSFEIRIKKWEEKYEQLLKADQSLYDQENISLTQKTETRKPKTRQHLSYKSKDLENVHEANKFLASSKQTLATWHNESVECFDFADTVRMESDDFYQIHLDFLSIGKKIADISDKVTDSFKSLSSNPENITVVRDAFFAAMSKIDSLLNRKRLILIRYGKMIKKKAGQEKAKADKEQKKQDSETSKKQKETERNQKKKEAEEKRLLKNRANFEKFKRKQTIKKLNQAVKDSEKNQKKADRLTKQAEATQQANARVESQKAFDSLITNLEIKRFEIRQKLQEDKLRQRGYDVKSRPGSSLFGSRMSNTFAFAGINSDDERAILGPVTSLFGKVGKNLGRGVKSLFSSKKEDPTEELRAVDEQLFRARTMKKMSKYDNVAPSSTTNNSGPITNSTTTNNDNSKGPSRFGDAIRSVKNLFSTSKSSQINDQDFNRTDDGEYLKEVKKTNEILTDILKFMKKTSKSTGGTDSKGLFGGMGGVLGLLAGGATALLSSLIKPLTALLGKVLLGGVGTIVKLAASVLPVLFSSPVIIGSLVAGGFFMLLKKQMDQLDAPNYKDPKTKDLMNLQGGMLPGVGKYKDYSKTTDSTSNVVKSSNSMIMTSKGPNNIGGDSYKTQVDTAASVNNINNQKTTSTKTDTSQTAVQDTLMKAADFLTPTVIEDGEDTSSAQNLLDLKKFLEGTFLDKLIDGLGEILKPKGGSGRSFMPKPRGL